MLGSWISLSDVGREFHSFGAAIANARFSNVLVNECGCVKIGWLADRRARFGLCSTNSSDKYSGAFPCTTTNVSSNILYETLCCIGSQWSCIRISEMCSWHGMHAILLQPHFERALALHHHLIKSPCFRHFRELFMLSSPRKAFMLSSSLEASMLSSPRKKSMLSALRESSMLSSPP